MITTWPVEAPGMRGSAVQPVEAPGAETATQPVEAPSEGPEVLPTGTGSADMTPDQFLTSGKTVTGALTLMMNCTVN